MYLFRKILLLILLVTAANYTLAQLGCTSINNRIKYSFPYNGSIYVKPLNSTVSYIVGVVDEHPPDSAVILAKTDQDSIIWCKKFYSPDKLYDISEPNLLPNGNVIFTSGKYGDTNSCYLTCTSPNGNIVWAKKMNIKFSNNYIASGSLLTISNNSIYFLGESSSFLNDSSFTIIAKLDFTGNILWSKAYGNSRSKASVGSTPLMLQGDTIILVSSIRYNNAFYIDSVATGFTRINANTGTLFSSVKLKTGFDNFIKGITAVESKTFPDNSIGLSGQVAINYTSFPGGVNSVYGWPFTIRLTNDFNKIQATYFTYDNNLVVAFDSQNFNTQINNNKQTGYLLIDSWSRLGYFVSLDSNAAIKRSRVFRPQSTGFFLDGSFHFDNDATFFYSFPFNPNLHQTDLEYSRISNLAEVNTLECFGKDTLVTIPHTFTLIKDTFSWESQYQNILTATHITITTAPFTINQKIICTQTSICDTIKIKGNPKQCANATAVFTLHKSPQCLLKVTWVTDTAFVKIISLPNDTTVNVKFMQPYHGYIRAKFDGCILKDSFYVDVYSSRQVLDLGKDTMLCPGKPTLIDAGAGFKNYLWQDGSAGQIFSANQPGTYSIKATDSCGNIFKDTVIVKPMEDSLAVNYATPICRYDSAVITLNTKFYNYTWSPNNDGVLFSNSLKLFPSATTLFTVSGERFLNCRLSDTVLIKVINCPVYIYFPNAFTPNNDGLNDNFKPFADGKFQQYELLIYNRFGKLVFSTKKITEGWDGTLKSKLQNTGAFIWYCNYKIQNDTTKFTKGTVLLIR